MTERSRGPDPVVRLIVAVLGSSLLAFGVATAVDAAPASDVTVEELTVLVDEAVEDDDALEQLRSVERVDGHPVDLEAATAGIDGHPDLRAERLRGLAEVLEADGSAGSTSGAPVDPSSARDAAEEVLDDRKYKPTELPRPVAGPLEWLADRLRPLGEAWESVSGPVLRFADRIPGGRYLLFLALVGAAAAATIWITGRRSRAEVERSGSSSLVDLSSDPSHLEREADEAEQAGEHARAVRRRYEAGLLRLLADGRLELTPATTASGAAVQVDDPAMDEATLTFQEVVYGGRAARADDSSRSRELWAGLVGAGAHR